MGYLDETGLAYFWQKVKAYVDAHSGGGDTSTYSYKRFSAGNGATTQTLSTSVAAVTNLGSVESGDAAVHHVSNGVFSFESAGIWRVRLKLGMYPNSTAATRLCAGLYDTSVSGTRLVLGVQAVTNLSANTASKVVTVEAEYIGEFSAGDSIAIGAFADVANAKVLKNSTSSDLTCVTFEKLS